MEIVFDRKRLFALLRDFHRVMGLRVGVYRLDFSEVAAYPVRHSGFCRYIRGSQAGYDRCIACDRAAFLAVQCAQRAHIYRCHAGLVEAVAPIRSQERLLGYVMIGQMRPDDEARFLPEKLDIVGIAADEAQLREAYHSMTQMSEEHIRACARILQASTVSIWLEDYIRIQGEDLAGRLGLYIDAHLQEPMTLPELCTVLGVGKTTLCVCAAKQFGVSVGSLIRSRRVQKAKQLLKDTDGSVTEIAAQVGIPDYNYFSKVFKKECGCAPTAYRKQIMAGVRPLK